MMFLFLFLFLESFRGFQGDPFPNYDMILIIIIMAII